MGGATVHMGPVERYGIDWIEFVPQAANPGSVAANTLYQDDGSNFVADTLVWGSPAAFAANFSVGPVGTEQGGISVNGAAYDAVQKINSIGGALDASLILHRHSTAFPANLTFARANDDTEDHTAVTNGQVLGSLIYAGWSGNHYSLGAQVDARVASIGTVGVGSLPTEIAYRTTPDGSQIPLLSMIIGSDQVIYGSNVSQGTLDLAGTQNADLGFINLNSPVIFGPYTDNPLAAYGFDYSVTDNPVGNFVGGGLNFSGNITTGGATFIYESFRGAPTITTGSVLGFAAYTVLQALPKLLAGAASNHHPLSPIILNAGATVQNDFSGTRTVNAVQGVSFQSRLTTTVSGAVLNCGDWVGLTVAPTWSTVNGSTISFGNIIGVDVRRPAQGLFGGSGGIERASSFHALKVQNPTINNGFGTMPCSAVRSEITIGTNRYFLLNAGTAPSDMGAAHMYFDDNFGIAFGGAGVTNFDYWGSWNGAGNYWRQFFTFSASALRWSSPANNRFLFDNDGGSTSGEYNFNCAKFSLGAQTGSNGNQVGAFVAGTRTIGLVGDWTDFLLTQAGSLTVGGLGMGRVSAWLINGVSYASSSGSVGEADTLTVGGFPTSSPGVTITTRQSLNVIGGRSRFKSAIQYDPISPTALGAGNNNNWAGLLTGSANNNMRHWARISGNATTSVLTGIDSGSAQDGDSFELTNISANIIDISHQDAASTAANRIISPTAATYQLGPDETVLVRYDATTARWRLLGGTGA